jgi:hypothetical protein
MSSNINPFPITWPSQSNAYLILSHVLNYSICKWVDWVAQYYMNLYPMSKCYASYLRVTVVTFTQ